MSLCFVDSNVSLHIGDGVVGGSFPQHYFFFSLAKALISDAKRIFNGGANQLEVPTNFPFVPCDRLKQPRDVLQTIKLDLVKTSRFIKSQ